MGKEHICTEFVDCDPVVANGQLTHAKKCKECGRVVTVHGPFVSQERANKLEGFVELIYNCEIPEDDHEAAKLLRSLAAKAKELRDSRS